MLKKVASLGASVSNEHLNKFIEYFHIHKNDEFLAVESLLDKGKICNDFVGYLFVSQIQARVSIFSNCPNIFPGAR